MRTRELWVPHISRSEMWEGCRTAFVEPEQKAGVLNAFRPDRHGCAGSSLPHLATRDMGHPQFLVLGPKRRKQIFLIRMFFIFLGGPKAHEPSGRDDKGRGVAQVEVASG